MPDNFTVKTKKHLLFFPNHFMFHSLSFLRLSFTTGRFRDISSGGGKGVTSSFETDKFSFGRFLSFLLRSLLSFSLSRV